MVRTMGFHPINLGSIPSKSILFKWLFLYWYNPTDTPSINSKINIWAFINIRIFKTKISNSIVYYITTLNNIQFKKIKIFYKNNNYNYIFNKTILIIILIILNLSIFILL